MSTGRTPLALRPCFDAPPVRTAMVMAAGLGKRMRPLTATRPKPLVPVGGKALLDHVLDHLRAAGIGRVVVNVHYLADAVEAHLAARAGDLDIRISDERDQLLETGGGLVKVTMTCRHDVKRVAIDPSLLADDKDMLEDLVAAVKEQLGRRGDEDDDGDEK